MSYVRALRTAAGLSQQALASTLGVGRAVVRRWERYPEPPLTLAPEIATALDLIERAVLGTGRATEQLLLRSSRRGSPLPEPERVLVECRARAQRC